MTTKKAADALKEIEIWLPLAERQWFHQLNACYTPMWEDLGREINGLLYQLESAIKNQETEIYQRLGELSAAKFRSFFSKPIPEMIFTFEQINKSIIDFGELFPETELEFLSEKKLSFANDDKVRVRLWKSSLQAAISHKRFVYRLDNELRRWLK
ncbi:MAG TPA: hypothetical protein ENN84_06445, partial [Candidatus Marinimicrobia bacterium]|nr:hypothetical protein [Candidatus Neomarinimicrobiota bacterium]